jgi:DNA replication and repair protein RecF
MLLATGSPRTRRRFLDLMISQRNQEYLRALISYEKIRAQRNSLLQRIKERQASDKELSFWDDGLIAEGTTIIREREGAVSLLNSLISDIYGNISGVKDDSLSIIYQKSEGFEYNIRECHQKEIWQGCTLFGPHRDDFIISLNGLNIANFASRGEIRSAVLAIKIAELEFLKIGNNSSPILLLDDVYSEFDEERREHLNQIVKNYQSVVTTTDMSHLSKQLLDNAKIVEMSKSGKN